MLPAGLLGPSYLAVGGWCGAREPLGVLKVSWRAHSIERRRHENAKRAMLTKYAGAGGIS
jgi:hypothetical protein